MDKQTSVKPKNPHLLPLDLVATTVHELKSPLTLISGLAEMLQNEQFGRTTKKQRQYLERITLASDRLLTIVDGLLTINRSHHRRLLLNPEPVYIRGLLQEVLNELEAQITHLKIKINWQPMRKMPLVIADRSCLYQILFNLLDNALKYSPPATTITIKIQLRKNQLAIAVSDQGIGVKPSDLDQLFQRFGTSSRPISGRASSSGLGLFIVKNLVELQGGTVTAKTLSKGSCFTVNLPVAQQLALFVQPSHENSTS